ncbi:MAG: hypothetical protein K2W95_17205 [Candidatus Obscuribacterales bacterium]|nr:hypothetical protein [Candidatus Obscuribacterales bacterium]
MDKSPERKVHNFEEKAFEALSLLAVAWAREIKDWVTCSASEAKRLSEESGTKALARVALFDDPAASVYDTV